MFKVAPRYLSGVSVFLGDDISKRSTTGELAIFVGPATMGPSVPVQLNTVDSATAIYGTSNPLVKALYEFYDGYVDGGKNIPLNYVTLRVGGKPASLTTSYGLGLKTTDAYDGIENDYFVYVDNTSVESAVVKIWDKNKLLVLDSSSGINTGHFDSAFLSIPVGDGGVTGIYGVDIDQDPMATPVSMSGLVGLDIFDPNGTALTLTGALLADDTTIVVAEDISLFPTAGVLQIKQTNGGLPATIQYVAYTAIDIATKTFTLDGTVGAALASTSTVSLIGSTLVKGDSELDMTERELYEKFRVALDDIEMYTPDYIVPGGVSYDAKVTYNKTYNQSTVLKADLTGASTYAIVDAAANWPVTGIVDLYDGTSHDVLRYTGKTVAGADFRLELATPTFGIAVDAGGLFGTVSVSGTAPISDLFTEGYVKVGNTTVHYTRSLSTPNRIDFDAPGITVAGDKSAVTCKKVAGATVIASVPVLVSTTYELAEPFELGIGFVKETEENGEYTFEWSNTKEAGFGLAHFGYLFANFCQTASIGYNTPLCGMNVALPTSFDRASIIAWAGKSPVLKVKVDDDTAVEAVVMNGKNLLGDASIVGSVNYNRTYMSNPAENFYADPAFGLLLTDEGYIDGHPVIDDYNNTVDLGKFLVVGAGILTFNNKASNSAYYDTCGIYTLGALAGSKKDQGISFLRVASGSNVGVSVIINRNVYADLAKAGYIVLTREKGLGWVLNNSNSVAREQSAYYLISTTRTVKYVVEGKRSILVGFIGKPVNRYIYEAARTALADSFSADVRAGLLATTPEWDLQIIQSAKAIGKFQLVCKLNPALELTQVDIDAVIDRSSAIV